jgi:large subunit ribosomal protein L17
MRHRKAGFKLGRNTSHRRALLRNLVTSILMEDRVVTTVTKAKAVRPHVEKMITLGKRGDLHARRQALSTLSQDKFAVHKLFVELAPRYQERPGGYTRILKLGPRRSDATEMVFIELV